MAMEQQEDDLPPLQNTCSNTACLTNERGHPITLCQGKTKQPADQQHRPLKRGFLASKRPAKGSTKAVPEMFHLKPSTPADVVALQRQELLQQLQPDEATVQDVLGDATLIAGFDDPHVMQAVAEIANDPSAMAKYSTNPTIVDFYKHMAAVMHKKLERATTAGGGGTNGGLDVQLA